MIEETTLPVSATLCTTKECFHDNKTDGELCLGLK